MMGRTAFAVYPDNPESILTSVCDFLEPWLLAGDMEDLKQVYKDTCFLYKGFLPEYQKSQVPYHNLTHALYVFLVCARMIHGACLSGEEIAPETIKTTLIAALFHDAGLIKQIHENEGTGAQFSDGHERRSIDFFQTYMRKMDATEREIAIGIRLIQSTDLAVTPREISYPDEDSRLMGQILASADLIAQISDRCYLEKLSFLYREFVEGEVPGYKNEWELIESSAHFYKEVVRKRLDRDLEAVWEYLAIHFYQLYGEKRDFLKESMEKNIAYAKTLDQMNYRQKLRRRCQGF